MFVHTTNIQDPLHSTMPLHAAITSRPARPKQIQRVNRTEQWACATEKVKSTWVSGQALLPSRKQRHSKIVPQPQVTWYNDHLIGWWEDFYSQNHLTRPYGLGVKGSDAFTWETSKPKGPYHQSHDDYGFSFQNSNKESIYANSNCSSKPRIWPSAKMHINTIIPNPKGGGGGWGGGES